MQQTNENERQEVCSRLEGHQVKKLSTKFKIGREKNERSAVRRKKLDECASEVQRKWSDRRVLDEESVLLDGGSARCSTKSGPEGVSNQSSAERVSERFTSSLQH